MIEKCEKALKEILDINDVENFACWVAHSALADIAAHKS